MITLLVLGATDDAVRQIASLASRRGVRVATSWTAARPDWVLAASADDRRQALARYALPAFRVIESRGLAHRNGVDAEVLAAGVARMAEIGADEPALSPRAVALTRRLMPWIVKALERVLGTSVTDPEDTLSRKAERTVEKASRREALLRDRPAKVRTPEEMQLHAERKAARKAARRAEKPSVIDPPRGPRTA